jgi:hypothetical protein
MNRMRVGIVMVALCATAVPALAQQRPLVTQDPEPVGSGKMLIDLGVDHSKGEVYPLSGLTGNLTRYGTFDLSFGVSPVAEIQIDGGFHNQLTITARNSSAPLASLVTATGSSTGDVEDGVIGAKIRLLHEKGGRPSLAVRFVTRLPNAKHDSGLGQNTTDFAFGFLSGKTAGDWRVAGNVGFAIMQDPVHDGIQNDVLTYGGSLARKLSHGVEAVAEINGHADPRHGTPPISTERRSLVRVGARLTSGQLRYDAGVIVGLTSHDPMWGLTAGMTWTFDAFDIK